MKKHKLNPEVAALVERSNEAHERLVKVLERLEHKFMIDEAVDLPKDQPAPKPNGRH